MAGRPPKPTTLKILTGKPGHRPLPEEREVEHKPAAKPTWLAADPLASPVWDELAPSREIIGLLTDKTQEEFAQLCRYIGEFRRNMNALNSSQLTDMRAKMNAFGFNPSGLAKLGIKTGAIGKPNAFSVLKSG